MVLTTAGRITNGSTHVKCVHPVGECPEDRGKLRFRATDHTVWALGDASRFFAAREVSYLASMTDAPAVHPENSC